MKVTAIAVAALAGLAAAAPKSTKPVCGVTQNLATYDDKTFTTLLPIVNPIGTYKGLSYQGIDGADTTLLGLNVQPVKATSAPNVAWFGLLNELTQNKPQMTVVYPGSTNKYVNLHSFYFACFADTVESAINLAQPKCTLTVKGFRNGKQVAQKSFDYQSKLLGLLGLFTPQTLQKATFEKGTWCNLDTITYSATSTIPLLNAVAIDNVDYALLDKHCPTVN